MIERFLGGAAASLGAIFLANSLKRQDMEALANMAIHRTMRLARWRGIATAIGALAGLLVSGTVHMAAAEGQNKRALSEADIVQHVLPSVVNITVWKAATQPNSSGAASKEDETKPLEQFYGSGFVVDSSGLILTNRHVVDNAQDISVTFSNGDRARATLCAVSAIVDLAMVKVTGPGDLPAAIWGDSDQLRVGDLVLAIGNPLGVGLSVSSGIVSALHRHVSASPFDDFIQTDASINHGNSGGALVDAAGEVVGVNTAFLSQQANGGSQGIGFAIPSFQATKAVQRLKGCNYQPPGWIGVTVQEVTPDIAMTLGLQKPEGSIVTGLTPDGPAQRAGFQEGDVLQTLNGVFQPSPVRMLGFILLEPVGKTAHIGYWRDGQSAEAAVTIAPWPGISTAAPRGQVQVAAMGAMSMRGVGAHFQNRTGPSGPSRVVVEGVDPGSVASDAGLKSGDVVLRIAHQEAASAEVVQKALQEAQQAGQRSVLLLIESAGRRRFVSIPLAAT